MKTKKVYLLLPLLAGCVFFSLLRPSFSQTLEGAADRINPIFADRYEADFSRLGSGESRTATVVCNSYSAFREALHTAMRNRQTAFSLRLQYAFTFAAVGSIIDQALDEIERSDDYLRFSWKGGSWNWSGGNNDVTIVFTVAYDTTLAQEAEISSRISQILAAILAPGMNDEEKAKAMHDWVVLNVAYDTTLIRHSIYDALFDHTAVCEGYALLLFKLLDSAGIPARIVHGTGKGEAHAWNLVYLCSAWFHVDATWDDPIPDVAGRVRYSYYNLSDNQIAGDHVWDRSYYAAQAAPSAYVVGICAGSAGYVRTYYVPYFSTDDGYAARWTGLALANAENKSCNFKVSCYGRSGGAALDQETGTIAALGQTVYVAAVPSGAEGWIKIESSTALDGLALIGQSNPPLMFDMDMKSGLHTGFLLSHLAADAGNWNSLVMACNPNGAAANLTYKYYNQAGTLVASKTSSIPAGGSVQDNLRNLFGRDLSGSMVIESSQPITAFMLYDSKTYDWRAGLSALPLK